MTAIRFVAMTLLLAGILAAPGCARYRVVVPEPEPGTEYERRTMHAYLWGAIEETLVTDNCVENAIDEVRVQQTFPNVLATVLTLGVWMPLDVEWRCAKRRPGEGEGF